MSVQQQQQQQQEEEEEEDETTTRKKNIVSAQEETNTNTNTHILAIEVNKKTIGCGSSTYLGRFEMLNVGWLNIIHLI